MNAPATESRSAQSLRLSTLVLNGLLIVLVLCWTLSAGLSGSRVLLALFLTLPLWAPIRGFIRRERRTFAWATLCVIPYFVLGLTESVANPQGRGWTASCLALSLLLFGSLIAYLRVTRPR